MTTAPTSRATRPSASVVRPGTAPGPTRRARCRGAPGLSIGAAPCNGGTVPKQLAARVAGRLAEVEGVVAVALGGSCARPDADEHADVDLGIYYHPQRPVA